MRNKFRCFLRVIVLSICFYSTAISQINQIKNNTVQNELRNGNIENGDGDKLPEGWLFTPTNNGYHAKTTFKISKEGEKCAFVYSDSNIIIKKNDFGNLKQRFDAKKYRGKRIKFRAAVRVEQDSAGLGRLWLRVDREGDKDGFFNIMRDNPIHTAEWNYYEIIADVDKDAEFINLGLMITGKCKIYFDDASISPIGNLFSPSIPPKIISERGLENIVAFTKLVGYLQYFHPSDKAQDVDWYKFIYKNLPEIELVEKDNELVEFLNEIIKPIAPTAKIFIDGNDQSPSSFLIKRENDKNLKIVSWIHKGYGNKEIANNIYSSDIVTTEYRNNSDLFDNIYTGELTKTIKCWIPLSLYRDSLGTIPHFENMKESDSTVIVYTGIDRSTRLMDVIAAWNILQNFYPYFDEIKADWNNVLIETLQSASENKNEYDFLKTLKRMIGKLDDGHGYVYSSLEDFSYTVPVLWTFVENKLLITQVNGDLIDKIKPGYIVKKINGIKVNKIINSKLPEISGATESYKMYFLLLELRCGEKDSEIELEVESHQKRISIVKLKRTQLRTAYKENKPCKICEIKKGVYYINLDEMNDVDFEQKINDLKYAKAIIFDMRGYPNNCSFDFLTHLIKDPVQSAKFLIPIIKEPDHFGKANYDTTGRWTVYPKVPYLNAKKYFLCDERSISQSETLLGIIESYKIAEIIGRPTAGTNGNVNYINLPGDYTISFTGMKVIKHNNSRHNGIGILPNIIIKNTYEKIKNNKDILLEYTIDNIN